MIGELPGRDKFQPVDQCFGLDPFMGFHVTHHHIHSLLFALVGGFQHGKSLADPSGIAQKDLQAAAFLLLLLGLDLGEQFIRVGTGGFGGHGVNILRINQGGEGGGKGNKGWGSRFVETKGETNGE